MHSLLATSLATGVAASLATTITALAHADGPPCVWDPSVDAKVVEYWHADRPPTGEELRCTGSDCSMSGYILTSRSDTSGNKPVIVFLHGSVGPDPTHPDVARNYVCTLANYFIPKGWALFMPYMRGYDDVSAPDNQPLPLPADPHKKPGFHNTGENYNTWATGQGNFQGHNLTYWTLYYMANMEMRDVQSSFNFLVGMRAPNGSPLVDPAKIAVVGHSFGGARAVLATNAHLTPKPRAVAALSGAAMSWTTPSGDDWGGFMKDAAAHREMPLYLHMNTMENPNGLLNAAIDTFNVADGVQNVGEALVSIYSQFRIPQWFQTACATGPTPIPPYWCAHSWFISSTEQSARWLPHVHAFFTHAGF